MPAGAHCTKEKFCLIFEAEDEKRGTAEAVPLFSPRCSVVVPVVPHVLHVVAVLQHVDELLHVLHVEKQIKQMNFRTF